MGVADQLQSNEEVLYQAHVSRISLIPWYLLLAVLAAGAWAAWYLWESLPGAAVIGVIALAVLAVIGWKLFVLSSFDYVLTNRRVIQQTGIFTRRSVDSQLDKVNNVEHVQTLWGRLLGYGDVLVDTASETGTTAFRQISKPLDFKRAIIGAVEAYRGYHRPGMAMPMAPAAGGSPSGAERMRQLKALLDDGLISPEEFEVKRREILSEI